MPFSFFISLSANDFVLPTTAFDEGKETADLELCGGGENGEGSSS